MGDIVDKIVKGVVVIVGMVCLVKCAYAPSSPSNDKKINGYYYDVIRLNDSTYLLNPTYNCKRRDASPLIITKDSLGFYLNENHL